MKKWIQLSVFWLVPLVGAIFCLKIEATSLPKIAFITAIYGPYEATCKKFVKQTIPVDFICFTNHNGLVINDWIIDRNPYHITHPCSFDNGEYTNSIQNNQHTFNIAKYYKQNFQDIPRLKDYDIIVWVDGTIQIIDPTAAEWIVQKIKINPMIVWEQLGRGGKLRNVTRNSHFHRYNSTFWFGQAQPYQDVDAQYQAYLNDGYDEDYWKKIDPKRINFGTWNTALIAFDNRSFDVTKFLNFWYLQTLKYTTQDQLSFPYVVQKLNLIPYTLPDKEIKGCIGNNNLFIKKEHKQ